MLVFLIYGNLEETPLPKQASPYTHPSSYKNRAVSLLPVIISLAKRSGSICRSFLTARSRKRKVEVSEVEESKLTVPDEEWRSMTECPPKAILGCQVGDVEGSQCFIRHDSPPQWLNGIPSTVVRLF